MTTIYNYENWQLEYKENILWLVLDRPGLAVNTLNAAVLEEFSLILQRLDKNNLPEGIILTSGKASGFIAGADIAEFSTIADPNEAASHVKKVQDLFMQWQNLPMPTVALISGFCLGGGLELALACNYMVIEDSANTRLGLPEVQLGILPGWGGGVRLVKKIGAHQALPLILQGRLISARSALRYGIVDASVPTRQLQSAAYYYINNHPVTHKKPPLWQRALQLPALRTLYGWAAKKKLAKERVLVEHYPAPFEIINNWVNHGAKGAKAIAAEVSSVAKLICSDTSRNLVRAYFLQERLKGLAKLSDFKCKHVHVIGAGTMGGDIAAWCALRGCHVSLQDKSAQDIAPAIKRAANLFAAKLKIPRLIEQAMDRLYPDPQGQCIGSADVVIEAIFEDLEVKRTLLKNIEPQLKDGAILASNTSCIPLDEMNSVLLRPDLLVGIHFFNPVAKMLLVEVVQSEKTSMDVLQKAMAFVKQIGRLPLPVKSSPGFLVNRILMPYLMESIQLISEGVPIQVIDAAAEKFGMRMGPIKVADLAGLDICLSVANNLLPHYGTTVPQALQDKVNAGHLGMKSGKGFYSYKNSKIIVQKSKHKVIINNEKIALRLVMRMLNEAFACLNEGVVEDGDLLDAGMIYGTGFAPFRGGIIQYAKSLGIHRLEEIYSGLATEGDRFKQPQGWQQTMEQLSA